MNLPYLGAYTSMHFPHNKVTWYGGDSQETYEAYCATHGQARDKIELTSNACSDLWQYEFNELGYRGESYDPTAAFTIAVIGCSITVGVGVRWEDTWGYQAKKLLQENLGDVKINCLNFSQSGASNDFIARTALRQFHAQKPSLAVVHFTHMTRREILRGSEILTFGSWTVNEDPLFHAVVGCYTNEEAVANLLKNVLLVSYCCSALSIPLLYSVTDLEYITEKTIPNVPALSDFSVALRNESFLPFRITWDDVGRDNRHPGIQSHKLYARRVIEEAKRVYPQLFVRP